MSREKPAITALAPWFGSNRMLGHCVSEELAGCKWVGVVFGGGMSELWHIDASTVLVNDLHRNIINLARVAAHPTLGTELQRRVDVKLFHPAELSSAQAVAASGPQGDLDIDAAEAYFVSVWMGRSARAGMDAELTGGPCIRWTGNGGSSARRYRSAVEMLAAWQRLATRHDFVCMDGFDFLGRCNDQSGHGIYSDSPFPKQGLRYRHNPGRENERAWHERLARTLSGFKQARVVCRFYDHPLIRELYPESRWTWRTLQGRDQANGDTPEVLLINGPSVAGPNELF